jgi:predicted small secreted protein
MRKALISIFLLLAIAFSLCACNAADDAPRKMSSGSIAASETESTGGAPLMKTVSLKIISKQDSYFLGVKESDPSTLWKVRLGMSLGFDGKVGDRVVIGYTAVHENESNPRPNEYKNFICITLREYSKQLDVGGVENSGLEFGLESQNS